MVGVSFISNCIYTRSENYRSRAAAPHLLSYRLALISRILQMIFFSQLHLIP